MSKRKKPSIFPTTENCEMLTTESAEMVGALIGSITLPAAVPFAVDYVLKNYFGITDVTPRVIVDGISILAAWRPMHYLGGLTGAATLGAAGYVIDTIGHNYRRLLDK